MVGYGYYIYRGQTDISTAWEVEQKYLFPNLSEWNRLHHNTISLYAVYCRIEYGIGTFSEDAVTVLGIYYKIQSFFFIPLLGF